MSRIVRGGLIQATLCEPATSPVAAVKKAMIDKHVALIAEAAEQGAQVVCLQELFYGPYFCAEQQARWYELTERVPDGPTTKLMAELARTARDRADRAGLRGGPDGRLLQHGGRDRRRRPLPRQVPQDAHPALPARLLGEVLLPARQPRLSRLRDAGGQGRRLHLLRPPFPGRGSLPGPERGGDRLQSLGDRGRALRIPLEARAAGARRGQRLFRGRHQPARLRGALADRRVLRPELFLRPARPDARRRLPRRRRHRDRRPRPRPDPRGPQHLAVLPRSPARDLWMRSCSFRIAWHRRTPE